MKTQGGQLRYVTFIIAKIVQLFIARLGRGHDAGHLKSTSMDNLLCLYNTCKNLGLTGGPYRTWVFGKKEIGYLHGYRIALVENREIQG